MAIPKMTDELNIISQLGDNPNTDNGLTAEELKAKFDEAPKLIKEYINNKLVPAVQKVETATDGNAAKIQAMESSLSETTSLANSAAAAAKNAQTTANEAKQAAAAAGGMQREFSSGKISTQEYHYNYPLSKMYNITLSDHAAFISYPVTIDWKAIYDATEIGSWVTYALPTISAGTAMLQFYSVKIDKDFTLWIKTTGNLYITSVVGYY